MACGTSSGRKTTSLLIAFESKAGEHPQFTPELWQFLVSGEKWERDSLPLRGGGKRIMNTATQTQVLTRFFIFGNQYRAGDDYVRCEGQRKSVVVAPGVGEVQAGDELAFDRCLRLVSNGVMREVDPNEILKQRC
jgi:hypothetical protein